MKIALLGYGKMGRAIEQLALAGGDEILLRIGRNNAGELTPDALRQAEVAIEFSRPESACDNVRRCLKAGVPVVCGTTGWLDRLPDIRALCQREGGAFLYASNFSIGVNLFFALNRYLATLMDGQPQYGVRLREIHHVHKLDAPSGTAITLADDIVGRLAHTNRWVKGEGAAPGELAVASERRGEVAGTHEVIYASSIDTITIRHEAHSREGFARGALLAAAWLIGRKGCFGMEDVLGL